MIPLEHVSGNDKGKIVLYGLSTCGWCRKMKTYLEGLHVDFYHTQVDLLSGDDHKEALAELKKWNERVSFPTLIVRDEKIVVGYNESKIKEAIG